jgi:hypothetical protein
MALLLFKLLGSVGPFLPCSHAAGRAAKFLAWAPPFNRFGRVPVRGNDPHELTPLAISLELSAWLHFPN